MVTTIVWLIIGAAFSAALPIGLLLWWHRTRQARLLPFFVGALIWFVFAGTLEQLLHSAVLLGDNALARAITGNPYLYMVYGGLAAGLFEETGRYVAFRWLINKRRYPERDTAVTYGIGHGGIEAMLTLGATYATMIVVAFCLRHGNQSAALATMGGSAEALSTYTAALGQLTTGTVLLAMAERAGAMTLHIALSIFVFLAARDRRQRSWYPFAIALHAIADMPAALYQRGMLPLPAVEIWAWAVALLALYSARKQYLEAMDP